MGEYRAYQNETDIKETWYIEESGSDSEGAPYVKWKPLDKYWAKVFKITDKLGNPKYRYLTRFIKSTIILAHGNADVEKGFSVNALLVTSAKASLSASSIVALRTTKDAIRTLGSGSILSVQITREMLHYVHNAHASYKAEKEKEQEVERKAAQDKAKAKHKEEVLAEKLKDIKKREEELTAKLAAVQQLLAEGNTKLSEALRKKDNAQIAVAQAMMSSASSKLLQTQVELSSVITQLHSMSKSSSHSSGAKSKQPCAGPSGTKRQSSADAGATSGIGPTEKNLRNNVIYLTYSYQE